MIEPETEPLLTIIGFLLIPSFKSPLFQATNNEEINTTEEGIPQRLGDQHVALEHMFEQLKDGCVAGQIHFNPISETKEECINAWWSLKIEE